jgi:hypothetical protein
MARRVGLNSGDQERVVDVNWELCVASCELRVGEGEEFGGVGRTR